MTALFPPFNRRSSFRKLPYFYEAGRGPYTRSLGGPSLSLDFTTGTLDPRITFSRPSNATYYDSTGKLTYAPNNLVIRSNDPSSLTNPGWQNGGAQAPTITAGGFDDPFGGTTASRMVMNGLDSPIANKTGISFAGRTLIGSIWLRTTSGTITTSVRLSSEGIRYVGTKSITVTTDWQRFFVVGVGLSTDTGGANFDFGAGSLGTLQFYGCQVEAVTYQTTPRDYVATTSSAYYGPRFDYDPSTLAARGLLIEEARTNVTRNSDDLNGASWFPSGSSTGTVTATAGTVVTFGTVSRSGTSTAEGARAQNFSSANGTAYAWRFLIAAGTASSGFFAVFDGSAFKTYSINLTTGAITAIAGTLGGTPVSQAMPDGWLVTWVFTSTATSASANYSIGLPSGATGSIQVRNVQLEAGAFATSYIPNGSSTNPANRSADTAKMEGTAFSSWYNQSEGTFVVQGDAYDIANLRAFYEVNKATYDASTRIWAGLQTTYAHRAFVQGSYDTPTSYSTYAPNLQTKLAFAYRTDDFAFSAAGIAANTDNSGAVPTGMNTLYIGQLANSASPFPLNGHIASLTYYRQRLPNAQLQLLTSPNLAAALALDIDFTTGTLDPRITFERLSGATFVDSTGRVTWAPENLVLQSQNFANAAWQVFGTNAAKVGAAPVAAPDGTLTAYEINVGSDAGSGFNSASAVYQGGLSITAGTTYIFSVWLRAKTTPQTVRIGASDSVSTSGTPVAASLTTTWQRFSVIVSATGTTSSANVSIRCNSGGGVVENIYVWGAQYERVTYQTSPRAYIPTTTGAKYGPRFTYDPVSLQPLGLLIEESRQNFLTYSQDFTNVAWGKAASITVTGDAVVAPDGTQTADKIEDTSSGVSGDCSRVVGGTDATVTFSVWMRADNNCTAQISVRNALGITQNQTCAVTTTWQRFTVTATGGAGSSSPAVWIYPRQSASETGYVYAWGAQYEIGSFATSYLPTTTGSLTRSADSASITGASFSSWFNAAQGTFVVTAITNNTSGSTTFVETGPASAGSYIAIRRNDVSWWAFSVSYSNGGAALGAPNTFGATYLSNGYIAASRAGGTTANSSASDFTGAASAFYLGSNFNSTRNPSGPIRRVTYYNVRAADYQLQQLTQ